MGNYLTDIAIVIPALNPCERMVELVRECKDAGFENIILVDDGSTDNSLVLCRQYAETNPCIKVIAQKNSGPSVARNTGIKNASGEFIALNDADDKWLSGKMKIQIESHLKIRKSLR